MPAAPQILHGIPPRLVGPAAALYWRHFGREILPLPLGARRGVALMRRAMQPGHGLAACCDGRLVGIAGLRDASGGLLSAEPQDFAAVWGPAGGRLCRRLAALNRGGPETCDMLLDGLAVRPAWRRRGVARALVAAAAGQARRMGHPGLRVEVAAGNDAGLAAWLALGFQPLGRQRSGWPWAAPAHVLRLPLEEGTQTGEIQANAAGVGGLRAD